MLKDKLKELREERNMTQAEVANLLEVSNATISKYEAGTLEPNIKTLKRIVELYQISLDELLIENIFDINSINVLDVLKEQKDNNISGNLYHETQIIFAYNTNRIEGSMLSEDQTRFIYETNSIVSDKASVTNIDDVLETLNHFKLVDYMIDNANKKISEKMIKEFHRLLKDNTSDSKESWFNVGEYKKLSNEVGYVKTTAPQFVDKAMKKLIDDYNSKRDISINDIIEFHSKFEKIHPFQDGNGRIGRIIMFKECLKNNIIPFIILDKNKAFYYRGLKEYQSGGEKGYLVDTCLDAQDYYTKIVEYYLK